MLAEERVKQWFAAYENGAAIAFSGGVDSTFLLACAHEVLGDRVIAYTAVSDFFPKWEQSDAREMAARIGARHEWLQLDVLSVPEIAQNGPRRCYHCKKRIFSAILEQAKIQGINTLCDGSNEDDKGDYRPGMQGAKELGTRSPLLELGLGKAEIRAASARMHLPTAQKPAYACLATRIPTGEPVSREKLARIDRAEAYLHEQGFLAVRVRCHGAIARIEVATQELACFCKEADFAGISDALKATGFQFVTLDLSGYKTGSMNAPQGEQA